jgi:hypothetical protein
VHQPTKHHTPIYPVFGSQSDMLIVVYLDDALRTKEDLFTDEAARLLAVPSG